MPARRQPGTGSLRLRGERWISQTRHPVTGRIVSRTHPADIDEAEAERLHAEWLAELAASRIDPGRMTLGRLIDEWLETRDDLSPATVGNYRRALAHAVEHLGAGTLIVTIDVRAIDRMLASLRRTLAPGTVGNVRSTLNSVMHQAEAWQLIERNPVPLARRSRVRTDKPRTVVPSVADVRAAIAAETDPMWRALWLVLAGSGCRPGEALALAWQHVDLEARTITIERTVTDAAGGGKRVGDTTKTGRSRTVIVGADVVDALRTWRRLAGETGLWRIAPDALLWPAPNDHRRPQHARTVRDRWMAACTAAGVPFTRVGALRHFHASTLMAANVAPQAVADRLGHSIGQTTQRYGAHAPNEAAQAAADSVPRLVGGA